MSIAKKLLIKPGYRLAVVNAPDDFQLSPGELPEGAEISADLNGAFDALLLFAANQEALNRWVPLVLPRLKEEAKFWVAYPKKSSKLKSDISRDSGWEALVEHGYRGVSLISLDDTWSAFRLRHASFITSSEK